MDIILWNTGPKDNKFSLFRTLGPYKLAHTVRQAGYTAQVIDHVAWMTTDELYNCTLKYIDESTTCLGISTTFLVGYKTIFPDHVVEVINKLSEQFPNLKIVFGGAYATAVQAKRINRVSAIFTNYSEDTFLEYVQFAKGQGPLPPFELLNKANKNIYVFSKPFTEKYNIETDNYRFTDADCIMPGETLPLEISRGCIFKCKFCNHLLLGRGKFDYLRSFELVKEELINNYNKWGVTNYYIICDTFNDTEFKIKAWYDMLATLPFKIKYTAYLRADLLDKFPDVPYMLQESGLFTAYHGLETFGKESSVTIGKGWSGKSAKEYIPRLYHDIWKDKIKHTLNFIVGLPGDTKESLIDTGNWFISNDLYNMNWSVLGLYKDSPNKNKSEFERHAEDYGYSFPNATVPYSVGNIQWHTNYWNQIEASEFVENTLNPLIKPHNARFNSWAILQLLQYGIPDETFNKEKLNTIVNLEQKAISWLTTYMNKLMGV